MKPRVLEFDGISQPISEWALDYGITTRVIVERLSAGWSIERAITQPMRVRPGRKLPAPEPANADRPIKPPRGKRYIHDDTGLTIREWAQRAGLSTAVLYYRLRTGLSVRDALSLPLSYKPPYMRNPDKPHHKARLLPYNGGTITVPEIADQTRIPATTIRRRLASGWTVERILAASLACAARPPQHQHQFSD